MPRRWRNSARDRTTAPVGTPLERPHDPTTPFLPRPLGPDDPVRRCDRRAGRHRHRCGACARPTWAKDVDILNIALGLEHEAINAYQLGAASGLLQKPVLDVAVLFQSHHKGHRDALIATIQKMGGKPVAEKSLDEYAKALNAASLKNQADVLTLAAKLELGATNAYLGVIPAFKESKLGQVAARLAADETMHWTALSSALGKLAADRRADLRRLSR